MYGYVTLNYYESPDNYYNSLTRNTDEAFKNARVRIERDSDGWTDETYANASGYYSFTGLSSGSHTVTFEIENEQAVVNVANSDLSASEVSESFTVNVSGATQQDYDWNWGEGGDLPNSSATARALTAVYSVHEMYDYIKNTRGYSGMDDEAQLDMYIIDDPQGRTVVGNYIEVGGADAQSDEVTHHEYMHNVINDMYGGHLINSASGNDPLYDVEEADAMDEGFPDYFSNARKSDHTYGGPLSIYDGGSETTFPNVHSGGVVIRFLYNTLTMDNFDDWTSSPNEEHLRSRIISGATWRLRIAIGTDADELAFKALQITPQPQSYGSFRTRMFAADDYYNSNANRADIELYYARKKIGGPVSPSSFSLTGTPSVGDVDLSWNDLSALEDDYYVEHRLNGSAWTTVASLAANSTSYTHENIFCKAGDNDHEYRIRVAGEVNLDSGSAETLTAYSPIRYYDPCNPLKRGQAINPTAQTETEIPQTTLLEAAYPNPFNPQTAIRYQLAADTPVRLVVFDVLGREVSTLVDAVQTAGLHEAVFDGAGLPSGLYLYRLKTNTGSFSRTMMLAK